MRIVLDASAAVDVLLPDPRRTQARAALTAGELVAPHLIDAEVLSAIARMERAATISTAEAERAAQDWRRLPCERIEIERLVDQIWEMRHAIRVTDAHYVALAHALDATLLTSDARLSRAPLAGLRVILVS